jgi:MAE_28990/MAE_18760-like HEPN
MSIRTHAELQEAMSIDFAWRKKELHGLKSLVLANQASHNRDLYIRAAITLLYAHWEGFVKHLGSCYLEFVARRRLLYAKLPDHFLAMAISRLVGLAGVASKSKIQACLDIVRFFRTQMPTNSKISWRSGIETKSNLNSTVFKDIVISLGLDYSRFETKEKLIDEQLLGNRNRIAHGQHSLVDLSEYLDLHGEVHGIMQDFYNQIDNQVFTGAYQLP